MRTMKRANNSINFLIKVLTMKTMQEIERRLMGDFTIESMMGNQVEINQMPCYSEDFNLRMMQEQYAHWCIAVKKLFLTDMVEPNSMQGRFAGMMKRYMTDYAKKESNRSNQAMKYLYNSSDMSLLVHQISMLAKYSHYKDADDMDDIPEEMRMKSLDPESVSVSIALYVMFTILVNDSVDTKQFNDLFVNVWFDYYDNWMARELMFTMRGNATIQDFSGVLIS